MAMPYTSRRSRTSLGVLLMLVAAIVTVLRTSAADEPLATLERVRQMHKEGRASEAALANAEYHGAHARLSRQNRWTLSGYATQGVIGIALGLTLVFVRGRRGAA